MMEDKNSNLTQNKLVQSCNRNMIYTISRLKKQWESLSKSFLPSLFIWQRDQWMWVIVWYHWSWQDGYFWIFCPWQPEKMTGTLKEQLDSITPALREMQLRKEERVKQFQAVQNQIRRISAEIAGQSQCDEQPSKITVNENDLSQKKLEEYQTELQRLHKEKVLQYNIKLKLYSEDLCPKNK